MTARLHDILHGTLHGLAAAAVALVFLSGSAEAAQPKRTKTGSATAPAPSVTPLAAAPAAAAAPGSSNVPLLPGAGSKEPVNIDADKLDYFDKEQKLVYAGDVVAVQGESTMKASMLTIFLLKKDEAGAAGATAPAPATGSFGGPGGGSSVRHMEADGPVTLVSKDQIGTGDHATYDKGENRVYLTGNVTLSQGTNITQGDRLIYDLTSGQAQVFSGATNGRVKSVFTPGSGTPGEQADTAASGQADSGAPKRKGPGSAKTAANGKGSASSKPARSAKPPAASPVDATAEQ